MNDCFSICLQVAYSSSWFAWFLSAPDVIGEVDSRGGEDEVENQLRQPEVQVYYIYHEATFVLFSVRCTSMQVQTRLQTSIFVIGCPLYVMVFQQ
jgi:hypothetical protein